MSAIDRDMISRLPKLAHGIKGKLYSLSFPLRRRSYHGKKIVACVFSVGERTESLAVQSITRQRVPVARIEMIRNVTPISKASNMVFEVANDADYVLWVDADMILFEDCTKKLLSLASPNALYSVAPLADPVFGPVGYIKLLNMHLVNDLKLRFRDVLGCDKDFCNQARDRSRKIIIENYEFPRTVLGLHHPTYTAKELFRKNQIEKKKRGNAIDQALLASLNLLYAKTHNPVLLAGILGELLPNPDNRQGESDPNSGLDHWGSIDKLLACAPDDLEYGFSKDTHPHYARYLV